LPDDRILFLSNLDEVERFKDLRRLIHQIKKQTPNGLKAKIVIISGEVHFPGEYLLSDKMNVHDLVLAAGGIKDSAYEVDAELTRMSMDTNQFTKIEHIRIQPSSFLETNASKEFRLLPYDRLNIKPAPLWNDGQFVTIEGEVNFPGVFQISNGETLQQLLKRAGGLSKFAFPKGAIFTRKHLREKEEKELERLKSQLQSDIAKSNLDALNPAEAARASAAASSMMSRLESADALGRLVIDLDTFTEESSASALFLKDGDKLIVPGFPASVSVLGEVNFPTSHMYNPELSQDDYISMSGGITDNAAENNIFVVKADGSVLTKSSNRWFKNKNSSKIQVGDTIVIPIDIKQSRVLEQFSYTSQIIYQMAVAAAAVNSF
jgi:polysaccharide export outer membrane protein